MKNELQARIVQEVNNLFEEEKQFLHTLTSYPSTRGNEQSAQKFIASELSKRNYEVDVWNVNVNDISHLPGFSPVIGDYTDAINVVGSHKSKTKKGRSLILNGHIDVVPEGPLEMWDTPPYEPRVDNGWMYGRGVGDMKAGLAANLFALDAIRTTGFAPAADVFFQSVVEEECTGNGALACLQRGYTADAALITEPSEETLTSSQLGVIWFQVHLKGIPVHVERADKGSNAIKAAIPLITALEGLEKSWNEKEYRHPAYSHHHHPLNLNVGKIEGGDWVSSVPAWCVFDVRMAVFPGTDLKVACNEVEACLMAAASENTFLKNNSPEITYHGFQAEGYSLSEHNKPETKIAINTLEKAHQKITGNNLDHVPTTATTDARFFGLYSDTPALVYGPYSEAIHGFNERVNLESVRRVTQTIALFVADWCGLEKL